MASPDPIDDLKDVSPITRELPEFVSVTWFALAAPRDTPGSVVQRVSSDVAVAMKTPSVQDRLQALSLTAIANNPAEAASFVEDEIKRWQRVVDLIGLLPE